MFDEIYYENPGKNHENCRPEDKILPYMVVIRDPKEREKFRTFLKKKGFRCVQWGGQFTGVLVNLHLRRFAQIPKPCTYACVDNRNYTQEEFMEII